MTILIALAISSAQLEAKAHGVHVYGFPDFDSCGWWNSERRKGEGRSQVLEGWILGFISGLNAFGLNDGDVGEGVAAEGLMGWIDQYCSSHPLDSVTVAGYKLVDELQRRQRNHRSR